MTDIEVRSSAPPPAPIPPKLAVAETARTVWRVYRRQPWLFIWLIIIPILVTIPVSLVQGVLQALVMAVAGGHKGAAITGVVIVTLIGAIVQYGAQFTCQGASIYGGARNMEGSSFTTTEALGIGYGRILAYFGTFLLVMIMVLVGFLLLVIPGFVVGGFLALAMPACVLERRGPIDSIKRSFDLVSGNWWRVLGTFLLAGAVPMLAGVTLAGIVFLICKAIGVPLLALILVPFAIPFFLVLVAVATFMPGVVFVAVRRAKEGGGAPGAVAGVFD